MKRFAADFTMIPLSGEKMDYPTVSRFSTTPAAAVRG